MFTLPEEIKILISFLITQGIKSVANLFNKDINGKAAAVMAIFVYAVIHFIEGIIALLPPEQQEAFLAAMGFVASVLGMFGVHFTYKNIA